VELTTCGGGKEQGVATCNTASSRSHIPLLLCLVATDCLEILLPPRFLFYGATTRCSQHSDQCSALTHTSHMLVDGSPSSSVVVSMSAMLLVTRTICRSQTTGTPPRAVAPRPPPAMQVPQTHTHYHGTTAPQHRPCIPHGGAVQLHRLPAQACDCTGLPGCCHHPSNHKWKNCMSPTHARPPAITHPRFLHMALLSASA
jgi:hypothetical protein